MYRVNEPPGTFYTYTTMVVGLKQTSEFSKTEQVTLKKFTLSDFIIESTAPDTNPRGSYGVIHYAIRISDGVPVALKKYVNTSGTSTNSIIRELLLLANLNQYPETRTVKLYGYIFEKTLDFSYMEYKFVEKYEIYSVMERLDRSLNVMMWQTRQPLEYQTMLYDILKAVDAINQLGYLHADLKPENIMFSKKQIRIIDFGISKFIGINPVRDVTHSFLGTPIYNPSVDIKDHPRHVNANYISYTTDSYIVAMLMIALLLKRPMYCFYDKRTDTIRISDIVDRESQEMPKMSRVLTKSGVDATMGFGTYELFKRMLEPDMAKRYSCRDALQSSYFHSFGRGSRLYMNMKGGCFNTSYIRYTSDMYRTESGELKYAPYIFQNYKRYSIRLEVPRQDNAKLFIQALDWVVDTANRSENKVSFDTVFNCVYHMRHQINDLHLVENPQLYGTGYLEIFAKIFQDRFHIMFHRYQSKFNASHLVEYIFNELLGKQDQTIIPIWSIINHMWNMVEYSYPHYFKDPKQISKQLRNLSAWICLLCICYTQNPKPITFTLEDIVIYSILKPFQLHGIAPESTIVQLDIPWLQIKPRHYSAYNTMLEYALDRCQRFAPLAYAHLNTLRREYLDDEPHREELTRFYKNYHIPENKRLRSNVPSPSRLSPDKK